MGWAGGSDIAYDLIVYIREHIKDEETKRGLYVEIYETLTGHDWDTVDEAMGLDPVFDEVVREKEPEWFDEEDLVV